MAEMALTQRRYVNYPEPEEGPDVPYNSKRSPTPPLRGRVLVLCANLMEWIGPLRTNVWHNAGFGALRNIRPFIEDYEPRFDPTVIPIQLPEKEPGTEAAEPIRSKPGIKPSGYYSVADYHDMYVRGDISPVAVVRVLLPLIRRDTSPAGEHSTAWFDTRVDEVMAAARASARRYGEGKPRGVLDGVPVAVKDDYEIDGYKTTLGSRNDYTAKPAKDSKSTTNWCVRQLEQAGAIILGKTSMHEFGLDTTGNNPVYGTPRNPYNDEYYTGGSSSGSAYAVSAGIVPVALGSDGGGSVRIPSSFCGVFGLKPSHGRLSFRPAANHCVTCAVNGPIAADLTSLSALFEVVSEPHPSSCFARPSAFPSSKRSDHGGGGKVLGIPEKWFGSATPGTQQLCRAMIDRLVSEHGYRTVPVAIPFLSEGQIAHAMTVLTDGATLLPDTGNLTAGNRILLAIGRTTPSTDYLMAQKLRGLLMSHLAHLWTLHPGMILVTPTAACDGWRIRTRSELRHGLNDGTQTLRSMTYVWLANFCGLPAITVPAGYVVPEGGAGRPAAGSVAGPLTEGRVPVGLMAMGEWTHEENLLHFGLDAEEVGADVRTRPPIWVDVVGMAREEMKSGREGLWGV